uniref:Uncharacterized protein n=1 Tax=Manihot esculenta TaxID=3983 RepID=A0A2C9VIE0_MANES
MINLIMEYNLSCRCGSRLNYLTKYEVSKEKAKTLGIDFIPLEVSLKDTIESLKQKGFLSI